MKFVEHKLATGAMLTGYLRDETTEMPSYNTRPGTSAFILKKALDAAQIVTIPLWT